MKYTTAEPQKALTKAAPTLPCDGMAVPTEKAVGALLTRLPPRQCATKCGLLNNGDGCGRCSHRLLRHAGRDHNGLGQADLWHGVLMVWPGHGYFSCRACVTTWPGQHGTRANPDISSNPSARIAPVMRACMQAASGAYFPTISARYPVVRTTSSGKLMSSRGISWWNGSSYSP